MKILLCLLLFCLSCQAGAANWLLVSGGAALEVDHDSLALIGPDKLLVNWREAGKAKTQQQTEIDCTQFSIRGMAGTASYWSWRSKPGQLIRFSCARIDQRWEQKWLIPPRNVNCNAPQNAFAEHMCNRSSRDYLASFTLLTFRGVEVEQACQLSSQDIKRITLQAVEESGQYPALADATSKLESLLDEFGLALQDVAAGKPCGAIAWRAARLRPQSLLQKLDK